MRDSRKVAVLGAETMGARIAAHLANVSTACVRLDVIPSLFGGSQELGARS